MQASFLARSLAAWHRLSATVLATFVMAHLGNHLLALHSIALHRCGLQLLRLVYRHPVAETLLLAGVLFQVVSGALLLRRAWRRATTFFDRVQLYSGLYLAFFLLVHCGAVLMGRYHQHLDTNFYFAAAGLNTAPLYWFFGPYYTLAVGAFFGHLAAIHYRQRQPRSLATREASTILLGGLVLGIVIVLGFTDCFRGVAVPKAYVPQALRR